MHEASFEEGLKQILEEDARYHRDAYFLVREALDYTQKMTERDGRAKVYHVSGQQLLAGIREYALSRFGPMVTTVLNEWGVHSCADFGEIVFNMIEIGGCRTFSAGDIQELKSFVGKLIRRTDPVSSFLWSHFSQGLRQEMLNHASGKEFQSMLADELNEIIQRRAIYQKQRFIGVTLSDQAKSLIGHELHGVRLVRCNRLLLEDAYPLELAKSHGLLAKTDKDSRADFQGGYSFEEAFRKPFLPRSANVSKPTEPKSTKV
jgi:uncharacterized repeat protein (TIGR04138 family)